MNSVIINCTLNATNKTDEKTYVNMIYKENTQVCLTCIEDCLPFQMLTDRQFFAIPANDRKYDIEDIHQSLFPSASLKSFFKGVNDMTNNDNIEEGTQS